jgi:hydroxylysine kinase
VIDFGDVVHTGRVFDVAVGMANLLWDEPRDPWEQAIRFVEGYLDVRPLTHLELGVLGTCAQARVLLRILMAQWRAVEDPARSSYLESHSAKDWTHLRLARAVPAGSVEERLWTIAAHHEYEGGHDA